MHDHRVVEMPARCRGYRSDQALFPGRRLRQPFAEELRRRRRGLGSLLGRSKGYPTPHSIALALQSVARKQNATVKELLRSHKGNRGTGGTAGSFVDFGSRNHAVRFASRQREAGQHRSPRAELRFKDPTPVEISRPDDERRDYGNRRVGRGLVVSHFRRCIKPSRR